MSKLIDNIFIHIAVLTPIAWMVFTGGVIVFYELGWL
jgi:hypothetical protein